MRLAVLLAVAASAAPLAAQPVAAGPCAYAECAIRVEPGVFGSPAIVQGAPGQEVRVGTLGLFGGGLVDVVADVPLALEHARAARRSTVGAAVAAVAGVAALALAVDDLYGDPSGGEVALLVGGFGLSLASGLLTVQAQREQARAVWEYNRVVAGR